MMRLIEFARCGHQATEHGEIEIFGERVRITLQRDEGNRFPSCHQCIAAMCIRCAWCGTVIVPGDDIALYKKHDDWQLREGAVAFEDYYVGCFDSDCLDSPDMVGAWVADENAFGKGRVMTLHEMLGS